MGKRFNNKYKESDDESDLEHETTNSHLYSSRHEGFNRHYDESDEDNESDTLIGSDNQHDHYDEESESEETTNSHHNSYGHKYFSVYGNKYRSRGQSFQKSGHISEDESEPEYGYHSGSGEDSDHEFERKRFRNDSDTDDEPEFRNYNRKKKRFDNRKHCGDFESDEEYLAEENSYFEDIHHHGIFV